MTDKITDHIHGSNTREKVGSHASPQTASLPSGNNDFIQEELEKGCGAWSQGELKGITFQTQCGNDKFTDKICLCEICQAKLAQHLATKQAMIKLIEELDNKVCDLLDKHIHVVDDCDCCEQNVKNVTECLKLLEELKQKLGELK